MDTWFRRLGPSELTVSALGLGCNNVGRRLDRDATARIVAAAFDCGVTFIDTADVYGSAPGSSEEILGEVLCGRRTDFVVATKFGGGVPPLGVRDDARPGSRQYVRRSIDASLRRLRTDYVDLFQMHRPDSLTPVAETLLALQELEVEGKIRAAGASKLTASGPAHAHRIAIAHGITGFVSTQNRFNLLERADGSAVLRSCQRLGFAFMAFSPLAQGLLTGKYRSTSAPPAKARLHACSDVLKNANWQLLEGLRSFASSRNVTMLALALGWLRAQGVTTVIAGATSVAQVRANVSAATWIPTASDLSALDALLFTAAPNGGSCRAPRDPSD